MGLCDLYFLGNRINSLDFGLQPLKLPKPERAAKRYTEYTIAGRSGKLHVDDGSYEEIEKSISFMCEEKYVETATAWLSQITEICTSAEPNRVFSVTPGVTIKTATTTPGLFEFSVSFKCYPLSKDFEEKTYEIINDGRHTPYFNLQNPSQIAAYPSFEIFGNGTITVQVGGQVITITDVDGWIMVEGGESLVCYDNDGSALNRMSLSPADDVGFPSIAGNAIAYIMQTGADRIIVMPNWRYL